MSSFVHIFCYGKYMFRNILVMTKMEYSVILLRMRLKLMVREDMFVAKRTLVVLYAILHTCIYV